MPQTASAGNAEERRKNQRRRAAEAMVSMLRTMEIGDGVHAAGLGPVWARVVLAAFAREER